MFVQNFQTDNNETPKLQITGPMGGNPPVENPASHRFRNAEKIPISWRHHALDLQVSRTEKSPGGH